jgi:hypothetical protein
MSEPMTEREAALAARVAELEAAAAKKPKPGGNIVEQIWHYLSYFVPPTIMLAGVLVFVIFHAWAYYNDSLKQAAVGALVAAPPLGFNDAGRNAQGC